MVETGIFILILFGIYIVAIILPMLWENYIFIKNAPLRNEYEEYSNSIYNLLWTKEEYIRTPTQTLRVDFSQEGAFVYKMDKRLLYHQYIAHERVDTDFKSKKDFDEAIEHIQNYFDFIPKIKQDLRSKKLNKLI